MNASACALRQLAAVQFILLLPSTVQATEPRDARLGCGEVCVRLLAHAFHRPFEQKAIRKILAPGTSGETSIQRLSNAIAALGLRAKVVKGSTATLMDTSSPAVLFLHDTGGKEAVGHFVVMKCGSEGKPIVLDPYARSTPITPTWDELAAVWSGYAILVSDGDTVAQTQWWRMAGVGTAIGLLLVAAALYQRNRRSTSTSPVSATGDVI